MSADAARVLVFPCGSEIGLEIHRALQYARQVQLIGASSVMYTHGKYVYSRYHSGLPHVDDASFIPALTALMQAEAIDFVFPAHDSVVLALSEYAAQLPAKVITSPVETCRLARSKAATYQHCAAHVRVPKLYPGGDVPAGAFPVFLKPDVGQGSKGVHLATTPEQVAMLRQQDPSLLALEWLPGDEYTVDCFTDRHGTLRFVGPRQRARVLNGISVDTFPVVNPELEAMAEALNAAVQFRGAWFFQAKHAADGQLALLEIAPRIAGTMALYRSLGVNFPLLSLFDAQDLDIDLRVLHHGVRMDRALAARYALDLPYEHVYVDLDDTLIVREHTNILLAAFLHQCRNRQVRVHLVTRHRGDLQATLARHALTGLFDSIQHLRSGEPKSEYIRHTPAIFLDDSFAERRDVHDRCGVPTFGLDALESLLDWRD